MPAGLSEGGEGADAAQAATDVVSAEPAAAEPFVAAPVAPPAAVVAAPVPVRLPPVVVPYELPLDDLRGLASGAGLEWVNSDADRIRAVQEAMAAEPVPVRVPRMPRPPVIIDEGPLVLVETRKDLSQMKLPFETEGQRG